MIVTGACSQCDSETPYHSPSTSGRSSPRLAAVLSISIGQQLVHRHGLIGMPVLWEASQLSQHTRLIEFKTLAKPLTPPPTHPPPSHNRIAPPRNQSMTQQTTLAPTKTTAAWLPVAALILGVLTLRLVYLAWFCPYDPVEDEAHYWEWSRRLGLSYYSKGPGIAWAIAAGTAIFGDNPLGIRAPAALAHAIGMTACSTRRTTRKVTQ